MRRRKMLDGGRGLRECMGALRLRPKALMLLVFVGLVFASGPASNQWPPENTPDLFVMKADGTGARRLTNDASVESRPSWSPDGRKLAYSAGDKLVSSIYIHDLETGTVTPLLPDGSGDYDPSWSPNGETIVFCSRRLGHMKLFQINADGANLRCISENFRPNLYHCSPIWSLDGRRIAFSAVAMRPAGNGLYILSTDDQRVMRVTQDDTLPVASSWSCDSNRVAFCYPPPETYGWEMCVFDLEQRSTERLGGLAAPFPEGESSCPGYPPMPSFRPNASGYLVTLCMVPYPNKPMFYLMDDKTIAPLRAETDIPPNELPACGGVYSPDGIHIAYVTNRYFDFADMLSGIRAMRLDLGEALIARGESIGRLLLGAHGELIAPTKMIGGSGDLLSVHREGDGLLIRFADLTSDRILLRVDADGRIQKAGSTTMVRSWAQLPSEWPFRDPVAGLQMPPEGAVLYAAVSEDRRQTFAGCEHWLLLTADKALIAPPSDLARPPDIICVVRTPQGLELRYDGPDWEGTFLTVDRDRVVSFSDAAPEAPELPPFYWPYVDEEGKLAFPPPDGGVTITRDVELLFTIHSDGLVSVTVPQKVP